MNYTFATSVIEKLVGVLNPEKCPHRSGTSTTFRGCGPFVPLEICRRCKYDLRKLAELRSHVKILAGMAKRNGISGWHSMTKPELVRALLRMAQAKRPVSRVPSRSRQAESTAEPAAQRNGNGRNGSGRNGNGRKAAKAVHKNGASNGHVLPLRTRDLCTTETAERNGSARKNYIDASVSDTHWIRVQWDLTRDSIRRAESRLGSDWHTAVPTLRILGVAVDDVNSVTEIKG